MNINRGDVFDARLDCVLNLLLCSIDTYFGSTGNQVVDIVNHLVSC